MKSKLPFYHTLPYNFKLSQIQNFYGVVGSYYLINIYMFPNQYTKFFYIKAKLGFLVAGVWLIDFIGVTIRVYKWV